MVHSWRHRPSRATTCCRSKWRYTGTILIKCVSGRLREGLPYISSGFYPGFLQNRRRESAFFLRIGNIQSFLSQDYLPPPKERNIPDYIVKHQSHTFK